MGAGRKQRKLHKSR